MINNEIHFTYNHNIYDNTIIAFNFKNVVFAINEPVLGRIFELKNENKIVRLPKQKEMILYLLLQEEFV